MTIHYNIYTNDGRGGPVDYSRPVATTSGLTFTTGPLRAPGDTTYAVRAFDLATGMEEANTDARVRIVLDAAGNDLTARPNAPHALAARATVGGGCLVSWAYSPRAQPGPPDGFHVYLTAGPTVLYQTPAATVPYFPRTLGYSQLLSGLADGTTYAIAVRAFNSLGDEENAASIAIVGDATAPADVESLSVVAVLSR